MDSASTPRARWPAATDPDWSSSAATGCGPRATAAGGALALDSQAGWYIVFLMRVTARVLDGLFVCGCVVSLLLFWKGYGGPSVAVGIAALVALGAAVVIHAVVLPAREYVASKQVDRWLRRITSFPPGDGFALRVRWFHGASGASEILRLDANAPASYHRFGPGYREDVWKNAVPAGLVKEVERRLSAPEFLASRSSAAAEAAGGLSPNLPPPISDGPKVTLHWRSDGSEHNLVFDNQPCPFVEQLIDELQLRVKEPV